MKKYPCSLDTIAKCIPLFIIALAIYILIQELNIQHLVISNKFLIPVFINAILLPGIVIAMYLLQTKAIIVGEDAITIERRVWPVVISFTDIRSVKKVEKMPLSIRSFGNGGCFGYTGKFYNRQFGSMTWYCTQRKNYLLIEKTNGGKIVISPDDPDGVMQDIEAKYPALVAAGDINPAA